jgi:hypothetical protein
VTFREDLAARARGPFRGEFGAKFTATVGLLFDSLVQMAFDALRAPWARETNGPAYDALRPLGQECSIPQFPEEGWLQYRARIENPWEPWSRAGSASIICEQLELAGFPGAIWYRWGGSGYVTEFQIFFPIGTHTVTGAGPVVGSGWLVGDGTIIGPVGLTTSQMDTIRGIIDLWKPHNWVCRKVKFELSGWTIGDGSLVGAPGLLVGGEHAEIAV